MATIQRRGNLEPFWSSIEPTLNVLNYLFGAALTNIPLGRFIALILNREIYN
jgi:hypothetical protein